MNCTINSASHFSGLQAGISPISLVPLAGSVRKFNLNRPFILPILPRLPLVLRLVEYRSWCTAPNDAVTGNLMRKLLKFGHSMTAITFLGSVVVLWVFHHYLPPPAEALEIYVADEPFAPDSSG